MLQWEISRSKYGNRVKNGKNGLEIAKNEKTRHSKQTREIDFPE